MMYRKIFQLVAVFQDVKGCCSEDYKYSGCNQYKLCMKLIFCYMIFVYRYIVPYKKTYTADNIKATTVILTTMSSLNMVKDEYSSYRPMRSKPALQKADIDVNMLL